MVRALVKGVVLAGVALALAGGGHGDSIAQEPGGSIQAAIDAAESGATITVDGGIYHERITIDKPLTLTGANRPVIDGDGEGDVVTITGSDVTISGFEIRGSGTAISQEPAAIKVKDAHAPTIRSNVIKDSLFGIHATGSHHATIAFNEVDPGRGGDAATRRGHGIYLWEVTESAIHGNTVSRAGDGIHLEFSSDNGVVQNTVQQSRYALHFMYSDNNRILENTFEDNLAGAVLMFSNELILKDNELSGNRKGATGTGILLKDVNNLFAQGNSVLRNRYGILAQGSPNAENATVTIIQSAFALNDTGLGLFSDSPITFVENAMIDNAIQVQAMSGSIAAHGPSGPSGVTGADSDNHSHSGRASAPNAPTPAVGTRPESAVWTVGGRGNYWSDYKGYDADGDGTGDRPYLPEPPFAGALDGNDNLRLFQHTLAQQAIDMAADMFPVYQYDAVIQDDAPLMSPPGPALPDGEGLNRELLIVSVMLLVLSGAILQAVLDIDITAVLRMRKPGAAGLEGRA